MYEKIVVVTRQTRMQELLARFNSRAQARFYLTNYGVDFADYESEDESYKRSLDLASRQLDLGLNVQFIDRRFVPNFIFTRSDIVVAIGQDGLVANVAKYASGQPIIGVNPDPDRFDGVLVSTLPNRLASALSEVLSDEAELLPVTLAEARLNDGQRLLAFNDFFLGCRTHVSARYSIKHKGSFENQSSSGIIVSTGAGSTGWLSSLFNMVSGVNTMLGQHAISPVRMEWDSPDLFFIVREPFVSKHSQAGIVAGRLCAGEVLEIESRMPAGGVIFSDGIEADFLSFNSGSVVKISRAEEVALVYSAKRQSAARLPLLKMT